MVERYLVQASSYAGQIDDVIFWVAVITGIWSALCFGVFFYLLYKFRAKDGVKVYWRSSRNGPARIPRQWAIG